MERCVAQATVSSGFTDVRLLNLTTISINIHEVAIEQVW